MRSALILAVASTVAAQYFPGQPACATSCLASAISKVGCPASDIGCQCGPTQASIGVAAAGCLLGNCNLSEVNQAQSAGNAVCSSFSAGLLSGVPASTAAGASGSSGTMSMTAAPSSTSSGAGAATTSTTRSGGSSGSGSGTGSGSSSGASASGSTTRSGSSSGNGSTTVTGTVVTTGSNGLPTTAVSTTTRPNAGATPGPALGAGILAGVIGAVVAL